MDEHLVSLGITLSAEKTFSTAPIPNVPKMYQILPKDDLHSLHSLEANSRYNISTRQKGGGEKSVTKIRTMRIRVACSSPLQGPLGATPHHSLH